MCSGLILALAMSTSALAQSPQRSRAAPAQAVVVGPAENGRLVLERARGLLQTGGEAAAAEAYSLLAPLEPRWSGTVDFSYLFGRAALESGKPSEAIFSLQRAVVADPGFAAARLDLARAYFEAGDNEDARREFNTLIAQQPPPEALVIIRRYLKAIDHRSLRYRAGWQAMAEFSGGYDSNANGGTSDTTFLGFALSEASREADSGYYGAQGQLAYSMPFTPSLMWRSALDARHREYPDAKFVSQTGGRLRTGLALVAARWQLAADVSAELLALDGEDNRQVLAIDLSGHAPLSKATTAIASVRAAQVRYDDNLDIQDVDQWIGALMLQWRPQAARSWQFQVGPLGGREEARRSGSPFSRDLVGARAEVSKATRAWIWKASLGTLESDYDGLFFGEARSDRQVSIQLQVDMPELFGGWTLRPALTFVDNQSDIPLYEYERVEAGLTLQRRW